MSNPNLHPIFREILGRWDSPKREPFTDTESIALQGNASMTPVDECKHSFIRASGSDRFHCPHCKATFTLEPINYEE